MDTINAELARIQRDLKAPKSQRNQFAKFNYRSCEDILEAVKPLLNGCILTLTDEVVEVGGRVYVKAAATIISGTESVTTDGYAREAEDKKGMDPAQLTQSTSSYARKVALNGLFCIDDSKEHDGDNPGRRPTGKPETTAEPISEKQVTELERLVESLALEAEEMAKGCTWASDGKARSATQLDSAQADKLIKFLKGKEAAK